jgi:hypothetical protein
MAPARGCEHYVSEVGRVYQWLLKKKRLEEGDSDSPLCNSQRQRSLILDCIFPYAHPQPEALVSPTLSQSPSAAPFPPPTFPTPFSTAECMITPRNNRRPPPTHPIFGIGNPSVPRASAPSYDIKPGYLSSTFTSTSDSESACRNSFPYKSCASVSQFCHWSQTSGRKGSITVCHERHIAYVYFRLACGTSDRP